MGDETYREPRIEYCPPEWGCAEALDRGQECYGHPVIGGSSQG